MGALQIGAFTQGMGEGYDSQVKINAIASRESREREAHAIAMENAHLELDQKQKEVTYQNDLVERLKAAHQENTPSVSGDVVNTQTGESLGVQKFSSPEDAQKYLSTNGLTFKVGTVQEKKSADPIDYQEKARNIMLQTAIDHGKVTLDLLKSHNEYGHMLEAEGAMRTYRYAMANPNDQVGIREQFNKYGTKIGDDITFKQVPDGLGSGGMTMIGIDKSGKTVFNAFQDLIMPSLDSKSYATFKNQLEITGIQQRGENQRNANTNATALATNKATLAQAASIKTGDRVSHRSDQLVDIHKTATQSGERNPLNGMEVNRQRMINSEILASASNVAQYNPNMPVGTAYDFARQAIYDKYNVKTDPLIKE